jgi:hypothetical protein
MLVENKDFSRCFNVEKEDQSQRVEKERGSTSFSKSWLGEEESQNTA